MSLYINNGAPGAMEHTGTAASARAQRAGRGGRFAAGGGEPAGHRCNADAANGIGAGVSRRRRAGPLAAAAEPACAGYAPLRFLLAAAGWLLTLLMLFGGHDWPALLAGIALGGWGRA